MHTVGWMFLRACQLLPAIELLQLPCLMPDALAGRFKEYNIISVVQNTGFLAYGQPEGATTVSPSESNRKV